jgi:DNA polymerase phi
MISLILRGSQTSNAMKGTEERDNLFARLFGLTSVVESGILFGDKATLEDFKICLGELMALGEKKSWIRESAWWTVLSGVKTLLASEVSWKDSARNALLQRVYGTTGEGDESKKARGMEWTQEKAALTLILQDAQPVRNRSVCTLPNDMIYCVNDTQELNWKVLLAPTFRNGSILSGPNLSTLGKLLKVSWIAHHVVLRV